ncbi:uncharacterized protein L201_002572 [Kwoniella dendrophila CBS 6074]|uniref:Methyltransferase domain-containing protein n=1 Tax=Kwoniella dendrophila CBS 6074 TaxID=1295534 RepID=A0AAX4JRF7_9TREE
MSYPSVRTTEGTIERNKAPIIEALSSVIQDDEKGNILEFGSGTYEHIEGFARKWENIIWWGTVRDDYEQNLVSTRLEEQNIRLSNLRQPRIVDFENSQHWDSLNAGVKYGHVSKPFIGVILINVIHCCPITLPEEVFKRLSPINPSSCPKLIDTSKGWIATYGPWLNDDGTYKSEGDEKFDKEYIKSKSPLLGLRTIKSITEIANKWGFIEESRKEMPKGNTFIVWRVKPQPQPQPQSQSSL